MLPEGLSMCSESATMLSEGPAILSEDPTMSQKVLYMVSEGRGPTMLTEGTVILYALNGLKGP